PVHFQLVLAGERRNLHALSRASIESPSVITALHHLSIQPPIRKRYPPVRARIPHRKHFPLGSSAEHQRHFQQHCRNELLPANLRTPRRRIPEIPKKSRIRLRDRKSTRLNSSHVAISYAVFCLKKKNTTTQTSNSSRS